MSNENTNQEAINLLDNLIGMVEDNHDSDYDKALKKGIKSLEAWDEVVSEIQNLDIPLYSKMDVLGVISRHLEAIRNIN